MARGDQIYVLRELLNVQGVYEHHGIDCGDGSVIHLRKKTETIERTPVAIFLLGSQSNVYVKAYRASFIPDVVLKRAYSRIGEQKYNLLFHNCEHFATWCKTGKSYSQQVSDVLPMLSYVDTEQLDEPIRRALLDAEPTQRDEAMSLFNKALADIKVIWDEIQPQYNHAVAEMNAWHQVAQQALKQGREDLARAALKRKLAHKQRATELKTKLDKLAAMTETLIHNRTSMP